jgi:excisionase family DNA binding protein
MPDRLYTTSEVCELLQCHRSTVHRLIARGRLVPVKDLFRHNRFRGEDLEQIMVEFTHDDREVIWGAMQMLAEQHAEDDRETCERCSKRRVNRGHDWCTRCEEQAELQRAHKLKWWHAHGAEQRRVAQRLSSQEAGPRGDAEPASA